MSAPVARTSSGRIALTVAAVPTGMNAGVRISPRCIAMVPVRAAPSVAEMLKVKRVIRALPSGIQPCLKPARDLSATIVLNRISHLPRLIAFSLEGSTTHVALRAAAERKWWPGFMAAFWAWALFALMGAQQVSVRAGLGSAKR